MKLETAKFRLYNRTPFFGSILFNIPVEEDNDIGTLGTDGEKIYYSKKYWESLTNGQQLGVLAHEIGHLYLNHLWRRGYRDAIAICPHTGESVFLFNLAGDYVINLIINNDLGLELPRGCLLERQYVNKSTEEVYEILKKKIPPLTKKQLQQMLNGRIGNDKMWGNSSGKKQKQLEGKMKQLVNQALEHQKSRGNMPSFLKRLFTELQPKEDWRTILMDYVQPFIDDYTFNPVDRRFLDNEFVLPDVKNGEQIDWIAIAIDTSGSISNQELNDFLGEVKGILESFDRIKVKITFCDAQATPFIDLEEWDKDKIKPMGGGGTSFIPVFDLIEKNQEEPLALLYFTDLDGSFPKKAPEYDVLWITTGNDKAKVSFGKILKYKI